MQRAVGSSIAASALALFLAAGLGNGALTSSTVAAQPAPRGAAPATNTIALDFSVLTAEGFPVVDLKAGDVQVRIDGRPRPVEWLEWIPVADVPAAGGTAVSLIPAPFGSNAAADAGRAFIIAIENDSSVPAASARCAPPSIASSRCSRRAIASAS